MVTTEEKNMVIEALKAYKFETENYGDRVLIPKIDRLIKKFYHIFGVMDKFSKAYENIQSIRCDIEYLENDIFDIHNDLNWHCGLRKEE